ncbi:hypothetical protein [Actinomadura sp. 9N407]|uniref:hypothetical protein n=1 Tax=Actinomadura sp. 9N407 TaxID=3375154 RepID=UPI00378F4D90
MRQHKLTEPTAVAIVFDARSEWERLARDSNSLEREIGLVRDFLSRPKAHEP